MESEDVLGRKGGDKREEAMDSEGDEAMIMVLSVTNLPREDEEPNEGNQEGQEKPKREQISVWRASIAQATRGTPLNRLAVGRSTNLTPCDEGRSAMCRTARTPAQHTNSSPIVHNHGIHSLCAAASARQCEVRDINMH